MPFSLKTNDLPTAEKPPVIYNATVVGFTLAPSKSSGNPMITATLNTPIGQRKDFLVFRDHWFEADFDAKKIEDTKERNTWIMTAGASNRPGKIQRYLGKVDVVFDSIQQLTDSLNEHATGKRFVVLEKQQKDDEGNPTGNAQIQLYDEAYPPKSLPEGTRDLREEGEPHGETAGTVAKSA